MIITISRQYGSGGSQVAKILAERMGVWCYDRDILTIAAERIGNEELTEDTINDLNYKRNDVASAGITGVMGMGNIPIYNQMFLEQAKIIRKLANYGSAVFLGRCADYILKEDEKLVRIFLYAPLEYRLNKVMEIYHDSHEDALRYIHKSDHSRKSYYEVISNKIWGDKSNYDLCLDCKLGNETIKDIICNYVKSLNK